MRIAALCAATLCFSSVFVSGQVNAQTNGASMVAFSTINLLDNGDFSLGTASWKATGAGISWRPLNNTAHFQLTPALGAQPSSLSFSQAAPKTIRGGNTICLRFQAQGNVPVGVVVMDAMDGKMLIQRKFEAPGDTPQTYTLAARAPRSYDTKELILRFYMGYRTGELKLSNVRMLDQGTTRPEELPLTPETSSANTIRPVTTAPRGPGGNPRVEVIIIPPTTKKEPVKVNSVAAVLPPVPLDLSTGSNLIGNGDFSRGDMGWKTWGQDRVTEASLDSGRLTLSFSPLSGDKSNASGMKYPISEALAKDTPLTIRFKLQNDVKVGCMVEKSGGDFKKVWIEEIAPSTEVKEYVFTALTDRAYTKDELSFSIWLGYGAGTATISDIQVLVPKK